MATWEEVTNEQEIEMENFLGSKYLLRMPQRMRRKPLKAATILRGNMIAFTKSWVLLFDQRTNKVHQWKPMHPMLKKERIHQIVADDIHGIIVLGTFGGLTLIFNADKIYKTWEFGPKPSSFLNRLLVHNDGEVMDYNADAVIPLRGRAQFIQIMNAYFKLKGMTTEYSLIASGFLQAMSGEQTPLIDVRRVVISKDDENGALLVQIGEKVMIWYFSVLIVANALRLAIWKTPFVCTDKSAMDIVGFCLNDKVKEKKLVMAYLSTFQRKEKELSLCLEIEELIANFVGGMELHIVCKRKRAVIQWTALKKIAARQPICDYFVCFT